MKVTITTPCRLHLSLIDLSGSLGRIDGGVGISLAEPKVVVEAVKSDRFNIAAGERSGELRTLALKILKACKLDGNISLTVRQQIPRHSGLGSTTQLYLAVAKAILELHGMHAKVREIAVLAGRGGTSGIGVAAFESGGFIIDCGHSFGAGRDKNDFLPSAYAKAKPPPVAVRLDFPNWHTILCIPQGHGLHGSRELAYFKNHFPAKESEAEKISRILLMKMIPAVLESNLKEFDQSVRLMNKARSFTFPKESQEIMQIASKLGGRGTSLSSFGPAVFTFTDNAKTAEKIKQKIKDYGTVVTTHAQNCGAAVVKKA